MTEENKERFSDSSSESSRKGEFIPGYTSIEEFTKDGFKTLMEAIKTSNALPSGRDWDFYNTFDSFKKIISNESDNVMRLMNQIMRHNELESNIKNRVLDDKIELIVEANDVILEKVANNIDELNGIRNTVVAPVVLQTVSAQLPINGSWNKSNATKFTVNSTVSQVSEKNCIKLLTAKNIIRPQKFFKDKIDNRNKIPWFPRITDKPNSLKPLAIFLEESGFGEEYSHPYEFELERFTPTAEQLLDEKPKLPKALTDTPLIEIDKSEQLEELVETLRNCKEFAVDVEHHSYRSFMGITCLLQISTQDKDYLIDALALRDKLHILNEVFTKNTIVKIFHGADKDIEWLQRDLSLYAVNMFDTHQAAKVLQYEGLSLAFLLKKFCNVVPNKQFQLADWRIRPLPDELKQYAREDTHYLIYIYKMLKRELLSKANKCDNLLRSVIEQSTEICKKRYFKPILHDDSHLELYRRCKKMFDNRQMYALKEIYAWRDNLAREEDESLGYVLPNHMMLQISETLPREMQGILACCNPIPPLVRSHLLELHHIVLRAREQSLEKAILKDTTGRGVLKKVSKVNVDSAIHCPHDLSKSQEFRDDLPTLLKNDLIKSNLKKIVNEKLKIEKSASYSIFNLDENDNAFKERERFKKLRGFAYFSPFERYKLVKPFVVAEDEAVKVQNDKNKIVDTECKTNTQDQERTDDERIASIKDHFMQLSKKFSEELQAQKTKEEQEKQHREEEEQSLIQMGGSRKRKREVLDDFQTTSYNNFDNPRPNTNRNFNRRNRGKKRKHSEINEQIDESLSKKKKNKNNKQKQQQQQRLQLQSSQQQQQQKLTRKQKKDLRKINQERNSNSQLPNKQKKKFNSKNSSNQNTNFSPYDYASVDFRQFQGGAGSANSGVQIKQNFKSKNRKNKNKKGVKSSTFAGNRPSRINYSNKNY